MKQNHPAQNSHRATGGAVLRHARFAAQGLVLLIASLFLLTGCGQGLPDNIRQEATSVKKSLDTTRDYIKSQKDKYASTNASPKFSAMAPYAAKEKWDGAFDKASATLTRAKEVYDKGLGVTIKQNRPEGAAQAKAQIKQVNSVIQEAKSQAQAPFERISRIQAAMTGTQAMEKAALAASDTIMSTVAALDQGPVAKAREKFPDSLDKINARFAPFSKMADATRANVNVVKAQYEAHKAGNADYAAFVTAADAVEKARKDLTTDGPELEKDIDQLYQSYTKVLEDMKVDYFVTIKRESWDERSDYYNPVIASFTRQVSFDTFQALNESEADSIAELKPGFSSLSLHVASGLSNAFKELTIDPVENWPQRSGHNAASFYLDSVRQEYFHKYLKEENGKTEETGWVKVNPSFYEQNINNLGMAILSKPYGEFEPDPQAAPPGMAYVGNPQYGEWKKDGNGNSFWSWYGRYAFFSNLFFYPPYYYSYGSWNRWRNDYRHQKPYYGSSKTGVDTFGSRGTRTTMSPKYQNSTFSKTGGVKTASASVRGGGSGIRGGGPKSKGK